jgi:tight adherence protein B
MSTFTAMCAALGALLLYDGLTSGRSTNPGRTIARVDRLVEESGIGSLTGIRLLAITVVTSLLAMLVVAGLTSSFILAVTFGALTGWFPISIVRAKRRRRRSRFMEVWPDAIASLVSAVRAGISLPEACASLAERGPAELSEAFRSLAATYRAPGRFRAGLERLRHELSDPVADRVVSALGIAQDVGGTDLVRVLRTLGDFVREDLRVRKEIEARWSWTVTAARVAAAAPYIVLLMMASRPEAAAAYNSSTGVVVIGIGTAATLGGYRLMLKAAQLPEQRRIE